MCLWSAIRGIIAPRSVKRATKKRGRMPSLSLEQSTAEAAAELHVVLNKGPDGPGADSSSPETHGCLNC